MVEGNWFPMSRGDRFGLVSIVILILVGFLLYYSQYVLYGMSLFGWFMGLMMFVAPILSLVGMSLDKEEKR